MNTSKILTRREMLAQCSTGFGLMALQGLMAGPAFADTNKKPHFKPRAKHVILCYMSGGASQVDTFDPKPKLKELHGKPMPVKVERTQFNNNGNVMASPFTFKKHGQSGLPVSSLFPHVAESADELRASGDYPIYTPQELIERVREQEPGITVMLHPLVGGLAPDVSWRMLELFEKEVIPALKGEKS